MNKKTLTHERLVILVAVIGLILAGLVLVFQSGGQERPGRGVVSTKRAPTIRPVVRDGLADRVEEKKQGYVKTDSLSGQLPGGVKWKYQRKMVENETLKYRNADGSLNTETTQLQSLAGYAGAGLSIKSPQEFSLTQAQNWLRQILDDKDLKLVRISEQDDVVILASSQLVASSVTLDEEEISVQGIFDRTECGYLQSKNHPARDNLSLKIACQYTDRFGFTQPPE